MLVALGRSLRQGREARGIALPVLAEQNFLSADRLEALEAGDHTRLPERIYLIAQARRVATSLGLDADDLIAPLLEIHLPSLHRTGKVASVAAAATSARARVTAPTARTAETAGLPGPRIDPTLLKAIAALVAVVAASTALVWGWRQFQPARTARSAAPSSSSMSGVPSQAKDGAAVAEGTLLITSGQPSWLEVRDGKGQSLFRGLFKGSRGFALDAGLEVLAGRPDLVTVRAGSGAAQVLGTIDQLRWQRFSPSGERVEAR